MLTREPSAFLEREDARAAVRQSLLHLEEAVLARRTLQGAPLEEYARSVRRLRACEARMAAK